MEISREEVVRIAKLAKLDLSESEITEMQKDMSSIIHYMDILNKADTSDIEPLSHPVPISNVFREDIIESKYSKEDALKNSPAEDENFFKVPKVI